MCKSIPREEWSGVLFYSVEGSIKDPDNFKIEIEDILPLDKGTSVFTSYDLDNRFIDYLMEDPKRLKYKVGHIHSHNVMNVFFSGTDMEELNDSAPAYNYYLSLIVNNYMEMTAKIAFVSSAKATIENVHYHSLDEKGEKFIIESKDFTFEKEKLYIYDCKIAKPSEEIVVEEGFSIKVATLLIPKPKPKPVLPKSLPPAVAPMQKVADVPLVSRHAHPFTPVQSTPVDRHTFFDGFNEGNNFDDFEDDEDEEFEINAQKLECFAISLFSNSLEVLLDETIEDALDVLVESEIDPVDLARRVLESYPTQYEKAFPEADDVDFMRDAYEVLDILYDVQNFYPIINPTVQVMTRMVKSFEQHATRTI